LPEDDGDPPKSPEKDPKKIIVIHNGHQICVSINSADAHAQHGDNVTYIPCH
jgi:hypothetical protein